ncbi:MAG TPA: PhzF family phenazine biosynthesis protein [Chloroflexia bacterium]|nr:PhzF family phenazine biosynthesis protein [Chloroflexia bacterium]
MEIYRLDVFTSVPGGGNPTAVIIDDEELSQAEMQALSTRLEVEAAFVLPPTRPGANNRLRYFSPAAEMNLCGHATIGALWLLGEQGLGKGELAVETEAGVLDCEIEFEAGKLARAVMSQPVPVFEESNFDRNLVAQALGLDVSQIGEPLVAASTGRPKLLIPLADYNTLDAIRLEQEAHTLLCQRHGLTGLYPYTLEPRNTAEDVTAEARQFPYGIGLLEDPVTGVAMGALAGWLLQSGVIAATPPVTRLTFEQGHAMGRNGRAEIFISTDQGRISDIRLGGVAVRIPEEVRL